MNLKKFINFKSSEMALFFNNKNYKNSDIVEHKRVSEDEILSNNITKLTKKLFTENNIMKKRKILRELVFQSLKLYSINTSNSYIDSTMEILDINNEESWFLALNILNNIDEYNIKINTQIELHIFRALLYELIENFNKANSEYKNALELSNDKEIKKLYMNFIERANRLPFIKSSMPLTEHLTITSILNLIEKLQPFCKYYSKSKKSIKLAQKYYQKIIVLYEILAHNNPKKYAHAYIKTIDNYYKVYMN